MYWLDLAVLGHLEIVKCISRSNCTYLVAYWWPWKWGQGHQNLIRSLPPLSVSVDKIWTSYLQKPALQTVHKQKQCFKCRDLEIRPRSGWRSLGERHFIWEQSGVNINQIGWIASEILQLEILAKVEIQNGHHSLVLKLFCKKVTQFDFWCHSACTNLIWLS